MRRRGCVGGHRDRLAIDRLLPSVMAVACAFKIFARPSSSTRGLGDPLVAPEAWAWTLRHTGGGSCRVFCGVCLVRLRHHHVTRTWRLAMDSAIKVARRDLASRCTCACARSLCVCVAAEWLASISRTCGRRIGVIFGCFRDGLQLSHAPEGILPHPPAPPPRR